MSIKRRLINLSLLIGFSAGVFLFSVNTAMAGCAPGFQTQPNGTTCIENAPAASSCSPGIPCTGYDVDTDTTSNVDPNRNGPRSGQPVTAGTHTGGSCDGDFMNQMLSQAYLQASRDVLLSEQIIRKPDSVLSYTCFEDLVEVTAQEADRIFSALQDGDDGDFVDRNVALLTDEEDGEVDLSDYSCSTSPCVQYSVTFPDDQMDDIIDDVIQEPLRLYLLNTGTADDGNFDHDTLGGAGGTANNPATIDNPYNCTEMQTVWDQAHCNDFGGSDHFWSFQQLAETDPRQLARACAPTSVPFSDPGPNNANIVTFLTGTLTTLIGNGVTLAFPIEYSGPCNLTGSQEPRTGITEDMIEVANNCDYDFVRFDIMETYFEFIKSPVITNDPSDAVVGTIIGHPVGGAPGLGCSAPIPTGVPVVVYTKIQTPASYSGAAGADIPSYTIARTLHYDHVCVNPGCRYVPALPPTIWLPLTAMPTVTNPGSCLPL